MQRVVSMRVLFVFICLIVLPMVVLADSSLAIKKVLHVKNNEVYLLGKDEQYLQLDELVLDDGAQLVLDDGVDFLSLTATHVKIGTAVKIIAKGESGKSGMHVSSLSEASACAEPQAGLPGENGTSGHQGKDIQLMLDVVAFGDLTIDVSGGVGGQGGQGGDGQSADQSDHCALMAGGHAGAGGNAGDGGNGGNVKVAYSSSNAELLVKAKQHTRVIIDGGFGGKAGDAGEAGKGSSGRYIIKKTLTGNKKWVSGGDRGKRAKSGKNGQAGQRGRVDITIVTPNAVNTSIAAIPSSEGQIHFPVNDLSAEERLKALEAKYLLLLKRVEKLEAK